MGGTTAWCAREPVRRNPFGLVCFGECMSALDDREEFRRGLAAFCAIYAHEFTREARRGQSPAIFTDEPIEEKPNLVEMFEQEVKRPKIRRTKTGG